MLHFTGTAGEDDLLTAADRRRQADALAPDLREVSGQAVEVVLTPHLERMMMALGTFQPHSQEQLADHRGDLGRLGPIAEDHRRPGAERAALGRDDLAHKLVIWLVLAEG